ncbi:MAG: polymer-forming cytoskeletal protein [Candidatus Acidiferrales bacterium]|jgi:cytoskeletal protein CcmA (bactofilin family)
MWWSKQAQPATPSFSPAFSSTGVIDSPIEAPASQPTDTGSDSIPRRDATPRDDLRLDAVMEGAISVNCRRLTIGETAKAKADVVAREVIVYGKLTGHLQAADRIEIKKHGWVIGDVTTPRIRIEEGAYFKGTVQIERRRKPRDASQQQA